MENNRTMYQRGYEEGGQEMMKRVREVKNKPMENKDWMEEIEKDFDELFFEGERNSVYCKKHKVLATPYEVKSFARFQVEKILKSKQEEIEGEMGRMKKVHKFKVTEVEDITKESYNQALDDLKPIISNILK